MSRGGVSRGGGQRREGGAFAGAGAAAASGAATGGTLRTDRRAIADLRRHTLGRATRGYVAWIGRAVGWWTIGYLIFWIALFTVSAVQSLPPLEPPLPATVPVALAGLAALAFAGLGALGPTPSVSLDRRDLYRLALAPLEPYAVLRHRLRVKRATAAAGGALAGAAWTVVAPAWAGAAAPWAAPGLALAAIAWTDLAWLRYAGFRRPDAVGAVARRAVLAAIALAVTGALAGTLLGIALDPAWAALGPAGALATRHPLALVAPALLALAAHHAVRRSLASAWPPRFAPQSQVLTQLHAMRTFQMIAAAAGLPTQREADAFARDRLLGALHDRADAVRPRRSLRPPPADAPRWRAIAWRAASAWIRRPAWPRLVSVATTLAAAAGALAVGGIVAGRSPAAAVPTELGGAVDPLGQSILFAAAVFGVAWWTARAWAPWLGPTLPTGTLPIDARTRTGGRLAVGAGALGLSLVAVTAVGVAAGFAPTLPTIGGAAVLLVTVGAVLEKYGSWSGVGAGGWEAQVVAALVAAVPTTVAVLVGAPEAGPVLHALLLGAAWAWPV